MKAPKLEVHEVKEEQLQQLLTDIEGKVAPEQFELLSRLVATIVWVFQLFDKEGVTLRMLRRLFLGRDRNTEKTRDVLGGQDESSGETSSDETESGKAEEPENNGEDPQDREKDKKKPKGHGRNGVDKYPGAVQVPIPHPDLKHGDSCPSCLKGAVYLQPEAGKILRITGSPVLQAKVYLPERYRCGLCGEIFRAELPPEAGEEIYDERAGSIIALMKYGGGMPFYRLGMLQSDMGVPVPFSTQWDIVVAVYNCAEPAFSHLVYLAAQGQVFHNDDTGITILELQPDPSLSPDRTGTFTTGIVVLAGPHQIALFFSGQKHAGERLGELLALREPGAPPPIQMSDALSRNVPKDCDTVKANCNAHGRRNFVKIAENFPEPCARVLNDIRAVYVNDAKTRKLEMTPEERLHFHQQHSKPILDDLKEWMEQQFEDKLVEPNSGLGKAMNYMLNHWQKLTLFLREPGAPLDNNIVERALKMAILHRKNALFYKTENGARVGDTFMSLIHTCRLAGANPFEYLTALQVHAASVRDRPEDWMPWNFKETLEKLQAASTGPSPPT